MTLLKNQFRSLNNNHNSNKYFTFVLINKYLLKALRYILLSCLFLFYVSQPALAVSTIPTSEMVCCIDMDTTNEDMDCCDMSNMDMENCSMDNCNCSIAISISAFTSSFNKELNFICTYEEYEFPLVSSNVQTLLFPIWTPPDIA